MQQQKIAIIGAGPMAVFLVKHLIASTTPLQIVVYEKSTTAGTGLPYRQDISPDYMLSNIFSDEIPALHQPLAAWLRAQPAAWLARWNILPSAISDRAFYPRTLLGAYLTAQMQALVTAGQSAGHRVVLRTGRHVVDLRPQAGGTAVLAQTADKAFPDTCDQVILATGHTWDATPTEGTAALISPWPASNVTHLPAAAIGILGSSLSAVDVAVALAHAHGRFAGTADNMTWTPHAGHEGLHITMVSKTGILPEADFYYAYPYAPLIHLTDAAVDALAHDGNGDVLNRTFDLLMQELRACDADYVQDLAMDTPGIADFGTAYFARRQRMGAFRALRAGLVESRATLARRQTIPFRYALLRGHEVFARALPHLAPDEWQAFRTHLLPVFADCYAAVPHLSLERLAALRSAGAIDILDSGEDARFAGASNGGVTVHIGPDRHNFAAMVDARGQTAALPADLPFPSLIAALADPDAPLQSPFTLPLHPQFQAPVYCLSMPQLLVRYPFSQGLPNCDALSQIVAQNIADGKTAAATLGTPATPPR